MNLSPETQVRYAMEQILLPQMLFSEQGGGMINAILNEGGGFFASCLNLLAEEQGVEVRFKDTDFAVQPVPLFDKDKNLVFAVIIVDLPKPKLPPLSSRLFICHDGSFERVHYFTVEKSIGAYMLCGRNKSECHLNYGPAPKDVKEQFRSVVELCRGSSENKGGNQ